MARKKPGMGQNRPVGTGASSLNNLPGAEKAKSVAQTQKHIHHILSAVKSNNIDANDVIFQIAKATNNDVNALDKDDILANLIKLSSGDLVAVSERLQLSKTLILGDPQPYVFRKYVIEAGKVASETRVSSLNPRSQTWLSSIDVEDIDKTMSKQQKEEAYGYEGEDGVIELFDGSRRRLNAIEKTLPLEVFVSDRPITLADFVVYDQQTEAKLGRSARDNGVFWKKIIEENELTAKDVADMYGFSEKHVNNCIEFANINEDLIGLSYAPSRLGAGNLTKLKSLENKLDAEQIASLQATKSEIVASKEFLEYEGDLVAKNTYVIKRIVDAAEAIFKCGELAPKKPEFMPLAKGSRKSQAVLKKEDIRSDKKSIITYQIKDYPEKIRQKLIRDIDKIILKHVG
ncbi:TPA: hypothetical protein I7190_16960 [Vibrio vulnificus]|uniref:hypothetical protein n=1 Tax=Vibrio parahaemolyticus TaxID=670 RepID=UPI001A1B937D|nr:hypothetical protein [Vibrio parahaemolyticus]HAT8519947.1 hypothetical protein [Vibrio vulnificus]